MIVHDGDNIYRIDSKTGKVTQAYHMSDLASVDFSTCPHCKKASVDNGNMGEVEKKSFFECNNCGELYYSDSHTANLDSEMANEILSSDELHIGERVEAEGREGKIAFMTPSIYGLSYAVQFDDGSFDEYPENVLKRAVTAAPVFTSAIDELLAQFEQYEGMAALTTSEMDQKAAEARSLNLSAKALITDKSVPFSDKVKLDNIVTATAVDILDIKDAQLAIEVDANKDRYSRFSMPEEILSYQPNVGLSGESSWLDDALDGMEVTATTDSDLATRATEVVAHFTPDQLADEDLVKEAISFQIDYLGMDESQTRQFTAFVETLRQEAISSQEIKTAATESDDDINDFDPAHLFV